MSSDFLPPWLRGADDEEPKKSSPPPPPPPPQAKDEDDGVTLPPWMLDDFNKERTFVNKETGELSDEFLAAGDGLLESLPDGITYDEWQRRQYEKNRERSLDEEVPDLLGDDAAFAGLPADLQKLPDTGELPDWFLGLEELDEEQAPDWYVEKPAPPAAPPPPAPPADAPPEDGLDDFFNSIARQRPVTAPRITTDVLNAVLEPDPEDSQPYSPDSSLDEVLRSIGSIPADPPAAGDDDLPDFGEFGAQGDEQTPDDFAIFNRVTTDELTSAFDVEDMPAHGAPGSRIHLPEAVGFDFDQEQPPQDDDIPPAAPTIVNRSLLSKLTDRAAESAQEAESASDEQVSADDMSWLNEISAIVGSVVGGKKADDSDALAAGVPPPATTDHLDTGQIRRREAALYDNEPPDWLNEFSDFQDPDAFAMTGNEAPATDAPRPSIDFSSFDVAPYHDERAPANAHDQEDPFAGMFPSRDEDDARSAYATARLPDDGERDPRYNTVVLDDDAPSSFDPFAGSTTILPDDVYAADAGFVEIPEPAQDEPDPDEIPIPPVAEEVRPHGFIGLVIPPPDNPSVAELIPLATDPAYQTDMLASPDEEQRTAGVEFTHEQPIPEDSTEDLTWLQNVEFEDAAASSSADAYAEEPYDHDESADLFSAMQTVDDFYEGDTPTVDMLSPAQIGEMLAQQPQIIAEPFESHPSTSAQQDALREDDEALAALFGGLTGEHPAVEPVDTTPPEQAYTPYPQSLPEPEDEVSQAEPAAPVSDEELYAALFGTAYDPGAAAAVDDTTPEPQYEQPDEMIEAEQPDDSFAALFDGLQSGEHPAIDDFAETLEPYQEAPAANTGELSALFDGFEEEAAPEDTGAFDALFSDLGAPAAAEPEAPAGIAANTGELSALFDGFEEEAALEDTGAFDALFSDLGAPAAAEPETPAGIAANTGELSALFDGFEEEATPEDTGAFDALFSDLGAPAAAEPEAPAGIAANTGELSALFDGFEEEAAPEDTGAFDALFSDLGAPAAAEPEAPAGIAANTGELSALFDGFEEEADIESDDPGTFGDLFDEIATDPTPTKPENPFATGGGLLSRIQKAQSQAEEPLMPPTDDFDSLFDDQHDEQSPRPDSDPMPSTGMLSGDENDGEGNPIDDALDALFAAYESEQLASDDPEQPDDDDFFSLLGADDFPDETPPDPGSPRKRGDEGFSPPEMSNTTDIFGEDTPSLWEDEDETFAEDDLPPVTAFDLDAALDESGAEQPLSDWALDDDDQPAAPAFDFDAALDEQGSGLVPLSDWELDAEEADASPDTPFDFDAALREARSEKQAASQSEAADLPQVPAFEFDPALDETDGEGAAVSDWEPDAAEQVNPFASDWDTPASPPPAPEPPGSKVPDWLSELDVQDDTIPVPPNIQAALPSSDLTSYLASLDEPDTLLPQSTPLAEPLASTADLDLDKLFTDEFPQLDVEEVQETDEAIASADLLDELGAAVGAVSAGAIARQMSDRPETELSDRLQRLRKRATDELKAAAEDTPDDSLADVLPGVTNTIAPAPFIVETQNLSEGIVLTSAQQRHVAMLRELTGIRDERADRARKPSAIDLTYEAPHLREDEALSPDAPVPQAVPISRYKAPRIYRIDRLLISLLLAAGIALPFFVPALRFGELPPAAFAAGSRERVVFSQIDRLDPFDLVLVSLDFAPGAAAELDTMTEALVRHILLRGARPVFISGNPFAVLRAQSLMGLLNGDDAFLRQMGLRPAAPLRANSDYYIARFLPGSAVGLRAFGENIASLLTLDINGQTSGLNIESLRSLALILLISDRADDVRAYAEQIAPLTNRPFIVAVNAASAPLAEPYAAGAGVAGLLVGYGDALTYTTMLSGVEAVERDRRPLTIPEIPTTPAAPAEAEATPDALETPAAGATGTPEDAPATDAPPEDESATGTGLIATVISADGLNLRTGPGTSFTRVRGVARNTVMTVLGLSDDEAWVNVRLEDGTEGWVSSGLVAISEAPAPTATPAASGRGAPALLRQSAPGIEPLSPDSPDALRWYAMNAGIVLSVVIIALGSILGILRSLTRRRGRS